MTASPWFWIVGYLAIGAGVLAVWNYFSPFDDDDVDFFVLCALAVGLLWPGAFFVAVGRGAQYLGEERRKRIRAAEHEAERIEREVSKILSA